jgi:O-antigen/teichoic acid export membrane protein
MPVMNPTNKAARHSAYLVVSYAVTSGLNYFFGVVLSWHFSAAEFGVLGVAQSLLLLLALAVGSGFAWTAAHDFAALGVNAETRRKFRTAWLANLMLGLSMGSLVWLSYRLQILDFGPAYRPIIPLVVVTVVLLALRAVTNGVLRGLYQFEAVSINLVLEVILKAGIGLGLVALGWGVKGVLLGFVLGALVSLLHSGWLVRGRRLFEGSGWFDAQVIRVTIPLFVSMLSSALMLNLDVLGLKLLAPASSGDELSGFYQAAIILARTPVFLAQALTMVVFSYAIGQNPGAGLGAGEQPNNEHSLASALRSWYRFLLPIGLVLILAPHTVLMIFFPLQYQASGFILQVAALGCLILALITLLNGVLQASPNRDRPAAIIAIATLAQIATLMVLVPRLGTYGAALSLLAAGAVTLVGLAPHLLPGMKRLGRTLRRSERWIWLLRQSAPLLAMAFPLVLVPDLNRMNALFKLGLAGTSYLAALLLVQVRALDWSRQPSAVVMQVVQLVLGG